VSLGTREDFHKLERSPVMKPVDGARVWSIVCFVVPGEHRRKGVAKALLRGAIAHARRRRVRILEAYPVTAKRPLATTPFGSARSRCSTRKDSRRWPAAGRNGRSCGRV
jgi:GNAT superfamily N-acetyltransferase